MTRIRAFNCDNMEFMKTIPDKFYELAIVDPEYGIGIVAPGKRTLGKRNGQPGWTNYKSASWDFKIPDERYFIELFRISQNQIIFGANYFSHFLPPSKAWIVWKKPQPDGVSFAQAELAFSSFDISIKVFDSAKRSEIGNCVSNNKQLAAANSKIHPTQKPKSLYKWLLKNYAKPGDKIFDSHGGSLSIAIACAEMGHDLDVCELDKDYFEASVKRLKNHCSQMNAFVERPEIEVYESLKIEL